MRSRITADGMGVGVRELVAEIAGVGVIGTTARLSPPRFVCTFWVVPLCWTDLSKLDVVVLVSN